MFFDFISSPSLMNIHLFGSCLFYNSQLTVYFPQLREAKNRQNSYSLMGLSMPIHIGEKIKEVFDKKGISKSEFGRINFSRENMYGIF